MKKAPLVAVTAGDRGSHAAYHATRLLILRAGAHVVHLRPSTSDIDRARLDGLVVLGGVDVDPLLYRRERVKGRRLDPRRDKHELELIDDALARGIPILGICRGAQLLNATLGGTLETLAVRRRRTPLPLRRASVEPESRLGQVLGRERIWINTMHDNHVADVGDGLVVSARDTNGVIQGIERVGGSFVIGVQWHPELMPYVVTTRRLFAGLVAASRVAGGDRTGDVSAHPVHHRAR